MFRFRYPAITDGADDPEICIVTKANPTREQMDSWYEALKEGSRRENLRIEALAKLKERIRQHREERFPYPIGGIQEPDDVVAISVGSTPESLWHEIEAENALYKIQRV